MESTTLCYILSRDLSDLINMQHFIVPNNSCRLDIFKVGKMKLLGLLRRFKLKKKYNDSDLKELAQLLEL